MPSSDPAPSARSGRHPEVRRPGRPFDHSSDELILTSTLDLVAERGYERLTVDEVAARTGRAKTTLYRRWATKEDLVLAAVRAAGRPPEVERLPDHGSLRSDLLAVIDSGCVGGPDRRLAIFTGLIPATRSSTRLAEAVRSGITQPYVEVYRRLLFRAADDGQVPAELRARIPVLAEVVPAMSTHRLTTGPAPVGREYFVSVVDDVLLAALHVVAR